MKTEEYEAKLAALEETVDKLVKKDKKSARTIKKLEKRMTTAEDIEAVKKLMRAYGFYLEHWEEDQLKDLFSKRDDVTIEINTSGEFRGQAGVQQCYTFGDHYTAFAGAKTAPPEYLHLMVPISGIVDIAADGKTAQGRWYGTFHGALPRGGKLRALIGFGIWEMDYIKEDGVWKIWRLLFDDIFSSPLEDGWVKTPFISNPPAKIQPPKVRGKDIKPYPSGYIFPYHYKNPVSGRE
jgi:hypothetical protein